MTTNYERIKNMTIDEMANLIFDIKESDCKTTDCNNCFIKKICCNHYDLKKWLQQECE